MKASEAAGDDLVLTGTGAGRLLRAVLGAGATFRFQARGMSMTPLVRDGDVLSVAPLPCSGARVGDVVAVIVPGSGKLLIHRVLAWRRQGYLIQGDARHGPDGIFRRNSLAGRVTTVERRGRRIWFGAGTWGRVTALIVHSGFLARVMLPLYRRLAPGFRPGKSQQPSAKAEGLGFKGPRGQRVK